MWVYFIIPQLLHLGPRSRHNGEVYFHARLLCYYQLYTESAAMWNLEIKTKIHTLKAI